MQSTGIRPAPSPRHEGLRPAGRTAVPRQLAALLVLESSCSVSSQRQFPHDVVGAFADRRRCCAPAPISAGARISATTPSSSGIAARHPMPPASVSWNDTFLMFDTRPTARLPGSDVLLHDDAFVRRRSISDSGACGRERPCDRRGRRLECRPLASGHAARA